MNVLPMRAPIRRALTIDEMTVILARITAVEDLTQLLPIVVAAVYDTLLADLGLSDFTKLFWPHAGNIFGDQD